MAALLSDWRLDPHDQHVKIPFIKIKLYFILQGNIYLNSLHQNPDPPSGPWLPWSGFGGGEEAVAGPGHDKGGYNGIVKIIIIDNDNYHW